jgi:hypothetical protein
MDRSDRHKPRLVRAIVTVAPMYDTDHESPFDQAREIAWDIEVRACERRNIPNPDRAKWEREYATNSEVISKRIEMTSELVAIAKSTGLNDQDAAICLRRAAELIFL